VIACIKDPEVIKKIFTHVNEKAALAGTGLLPEGRALPHASLLDSPSKKSTLQLKWLQSQRKRPGIY
jgi:hypothetical protein